MQNKAVNCSRSACIHPVRLELLSSFGVRHQNKVHKKASLKKKDKSAFVSV